MTPPEKILSIYARLTGRTASLVSYEYAIHGFLQVHSVDEFELLLSWLIRENKRNKFQYNLQLGRLLNDKERTADLIGEAKAKMRNLRRAPTPKQQVMQAYERVVDNERKPIALICQSAADVLKRIVNQPTQ